MARVHGFRVYTVEAFYNQKKDRPPVDLSVGSDGQTELYDYLDAVAARTTQFIESSRLPKPDEPVPRANSITVGEVAVVREDLWNVEVSAGQEGLHPSAKHRTEPDQDLHTFAAEVAHRVAFLFPSEGSKIIVVTETINRRDPLQLLFKVLTDEGKAIKLAAKEQEDQMRELAKRKGIKLPPRQDHTRMLFERIQAADNSYIDDILKSANNATAVFSQRIPSPRGGASEVVARQLSIRLLDDKGREAGTTVGRRWSIGRRRGEERTQSDGVSELAGALLENDLLDDEDDAARYTDARIEVQGSIDGNTSIAVDTARDVFTYPVSDGPPPVYYYYDKVAPRVEIIAAELEIDVAGIDAAEVEQCLTG